MPVFGHLGPMPAPVGLDRRIHWERLSCNTRATAGHRYVTVAVMTSETVRYQLTYMSQDLQIVHKDPTWHIARPDNVDAGYYRLLAWIAEQSAKDGRVK